MNVLCDQKIIDDEPAPENKVRPLLAIVFFTGDVTIVLVEFFYLRAGAKIIEVIMLHAKRAILCIIGISQQDHFFVRVKQYRGLQGVF